MALIIFFRYPSLFSFSIALAMQNENALANKKNLKYCLYTTSIVIKSVEKK